MEILASLYFEKFEDAFEEVHRRKSSPEGQIMINRILDSPYGDGYVVQSIDAELYCESVADNPSLNFFHGFDSW